MSIAHTRVFYTMLMEDDHSALHTAEAGSGEEGQTRQDDPLTALLCPDCRMQNKFGDRARGENGQAGCVRRLRRLQAVLLPLPATTRQGILVPVSSIQTLIYFSITLNSNNDNNEKCDSKDDKDERRQTQPRQSRSQVQMQRLRQREHRVTLGIGLQWERGVVVGIVVRHVLKYMDPDNFLSLIMFAARDEGTIHLRGVVLSVEEARQAQVQVGGIDGGSSAPEKLDSDTITSALADHNAPVMISVFCSSPSSPPISSSTTFEDCGCKLTDTQAHIDNSRVGFVGASQPRRVRFSDTLAVVLVPVVLSNAREGRSRDAPSYCFYLPQDYQRFNRQRDCELADVMREKGLGQEEALRFLYLHEGSADELQTEHNCHLAVEMEPEVENKDESVTQQETVEEKEEEGQERRKNPDGHEVGSKDEGEEKVSCMADEGGYEYRERLQGWSYSREEVHPLSLALCASNAGSEDEDVGASAGSVPTARILHMRAKTLQEALLHEAIEEGKGGRCMSSDTLPRRGHSGHSRSCQDLTALSAMSPSVPLVPGKTGGTGRVLKDDFLLDLQRQTQRQGQGQKQEALFFVEFASPLRNHAAPSLWQRKEMLASREEVGRSVSADGRMQTTCDLLIAAERPFPFSHEEHEPIGWFPGKFIRQLRGDTDSASECDSASEHNGHDRERRLGRDYHTDCDMEKEHQVERSSPAEVTESISSGSGGSGGGSAGAGEDSQKRSSNSNHDSLSQETQEHQQRTSWYFGKYIKRLLAKPEEEEEKEGWFFGKYVQKAMTPPPPSPQYSQQIFNHRDSFRLTSSNLGALQDAISQKGSDDSPESDSDSSDSSEELGIHRRGRMGGMGRSTQVRLPRLPSVGWLLGRSVLRHNLPVPPPPVEVQVTVLGCQGLKSPSLLPPYSPVSFVEVSVGDNAPMRTNQAPRSSKPLFDATPMHFTLRYSDTHDEYVHFVVYERFVVTGQKAPLGQARLALAALAVQADNSTSSALTLKLLPYGPTAPADVTVGKGFYCPATAAAAASANGWQSNRVTVRRGEGQRSYDEVQREAHKVTTSIGGGSPPGKMRAKNDAADAPPTISILISKTDATMYSVLRQLKEEDEVNEKEYLHEQLKVKKSGREGGDDSCSVTSRWFDEEDCFQGNM